MVRRRPSQSGSHARTQENLTREHYKNYARRPGESPKKGLAEWFRQYARQLYKDASAKLFKLQGAKRGKLPYYSGRALDLLLRRLENQLRNKTNSTYEKALAITRGSTESLTQLKEKILNMGEVLRLSLRATAETAVTSFNIVRTLETGTKKEYLNANEVARMMRLNELFQKALKKRPDIKKQILDIGKQLATGQPLKPKQMQTAIEIAQDDLNQTKLENSVLLTFLIRAMNQEQVKQFVDAVKASPKNKKNVVKLIRMLTVVGKISVAEGQKQVQSALRDPSIRRRTSRIDAKRVVQQFQNGKIAQARQRIQNAINKQRKKFQRGRHKNFFDLAWESGAIVGALLVPLGALTSLLNMIMGDKKMAALGAGVAGLGTLWWKKGTNKDVYKPGLFGPGPIKNWIFRDKLGVRIEDAKVKHRRLFIGLKKNQPTFHNFLSRGGLQYLRDWNKGYQQRVAQVNRGRQIGKHPQIVGGSVHPKQVMKNRLRKLTYKNLIHRLEHQGKRAQAARIKASLRQFPGTNTALKTQAFNQALQTVLSSSKALNIKTNHDLQKMSQPITRTQNPRTQRNNT